MAGFLILLAVGAGLLELSTTAIVAVMAIGWLIVGLIEIAASRDPEVYAYAPPPLLRDRAPLAAAPPGAWREEERAAAAEAPYVDEPEPVVEERLEELEELDELDREPVPAVPLEEATLFVPAPAPAAEEAVELEEDEPVAEAEAFEEEEEVSVDDDEPEVAPRRLEPLAPRPRRSWLGLRRGGRPPLEEEPPVDLEVLGEEDEPVWQAGEPEAEPGPEPVAPAEPSSEAPSPFAAGSVIETERAVESVAEPEVAGGFGAPVGEEEPARRRWLGLRRPRELEPDAELAVGWPETFDRESAEWPQATDSEPAYASEELDDEREDDVAAVGMHEPEVSAGEAMATPGRRWFGRRRDAGTAAGEEEIPRELPKHVRVLSSETREQADPPGGNGAPGEPRRADDEPRASAPAGEEPRPEAPQERT